jgi:GDP-L-fucose synthase
MNKNASIYVAGHSGMVGSALVRRLKSEGYHNLLLRTRQELDLLDQRSVDAFVEKGAPEFVFLAAARVGGIHANSTFPAEFIRENLAIQTNVIHAAYQHGVKKLLFLGSSCIYPKLARQPITEDQLLSGPLEPTNEWYAVAKIAGLKMAQAYRRQYGFRAISLMPTNLYGPNDHFDLNTSHVLPALIRKFHDAQTANAGNVTVWGTGKPRREFLHVDDLADAALFLMDHYDAEEIINVGTGEDLTIQELAAMIGEVTGYRGEIQFDSSKPDGTPRKVLDVSKLSKLGWEAKIGLREGVEQTYAWYLQHCSELQAASAGARKQ